MRGCQAFLRGLLKAHQSITFIKRYFLFLGPFEETTLHVESFTRLFQNKGYFFKQYFFEYLRGNWKNAVRKVVIVFSTSLTFF